MQNQTCHQRAHPEEPAEAGLDVGFLAEVLADREFPLGADANLTIIDLTEDQPSPGAEAPPWPLHDDSWVGQAVTPDHVLAARRAYRQAGDGRPLTTSVGTVYHTPSGFAADYVAREIGDRAPEVSTTDMAHRLVHFLNLTDDDFLACFRFNGEITGEYLIQVARCESVRIDTIDKAERRSPEPSPRQRRRRKARSLRNT